MDIESTLPTHNGRALKGKEILTHSTALHQEAQGHYARQKKPPQKDNDRRTALTRGAQGT